MSPRDNLGNEEKHSSLDLLPSSLVNKPGTSMLWAWSLLWACGLGMKYSTDCTAWSSEWPEKQGQREHLWGIPLSTVSKSLISSFCKWGNRPRGWMNLSGVESGLDSMFSYSLARTFLMIPSHCLQIWNQLPFNRSLPEYRLLGFISPKIMLYMIPFCPSHFLFVII